MLYLWIFPSVIGTVLKSLPNEYTMHFFQLNKGTDLLLFKWVSACVKERECVDMCLCHRICVLVPMCLYIVFPTLGSHKTKKYYSVMKNRLNYKIPPTWANWALESLIWHLLEYYIICEWNFHQNENPSPYFAALSLPSPVLQVCNVWAQFLGEFPICLCACYLWQRTVPGQQL